MKNRYIFFKKLFKDYVVLFDNNSYGVDNRLKFFIENNDLNYLKIDKDNNVMIYKCNINNYRYYLIKDFLMEMIIKILKEESKKLS